MKWEEEGILLSSRPYGERDAVIEVLTPSHGRHVGLVKYISAQKNANLLEPGMQLNLVWTARLNEHLGVFLIDKIITSKAPKVPKPYFSVAITRR